MFYSATITKVEANDSVAVEFRDLKKSITTVPLDWVIAREISDSRPVIAPQEPVPAAPKTQSGGSPKALEPGAAEGIRVRHL